MYVDIFARILSFAVSCHFMFLSLFEHTHSHAQFFASSLAKISSSTQRNNNNITWTRFIHSALFFPYIHVHVLITAHSSLSKSNAKGICVHFIQYIQGHDSSRIILMNIKCKGVRKKNTHNRTEWNFWRKAGNSQSWAKKNPSSAIHCQLLSILFFSRYKVEYESEWD